MVLQLALAATVAMLGIANAAKGTPKSPLGKAWILLTLATLILGMLSQASDSAVGTLVGGSVAFLSLTIALMLRAPSLSSVRITTTVVIWLLALASLVAIFRYFLFASTLDLVIPQRSVIFGNWISYRYWGAFFDPRSAAIASCFILLAAPFVRLRTRWLLIAIGLMSLVLADSRAAWLGASVGALVLLLAKGKFARSGSRNHVSLRVVWSLAIFAAIGLISVLVVDQRLSDRLELWQSAIRSAPGFGAAGGAHNAVLSHYSGSGIVGVVALVSFIAISVVLSLRAARLGEVRPVTWLSAAITISLFEDLWSWRPWDLSVTLLMLGNLLAWATTRQVALPFTSNLRGNET